MYTNGSRFSPGSGTKRKLENGGTDDVSGAIPAKQHSYGESSSASSRAKHGHSDDAASSSGGRSGASKSHNFNDHLNPPLRMNSHKQQVYGDHSNSPSKSSNYGDHTSALTRAPASHHNYSDALGSGRTGSEKQHNYSDNLSSSSRAAQLSNQHNYVDSMMSSGMKPHNNPSHLNHRDGAGLGSSKQYALHNYSYDMMGMHSAPQNQYNFNDKGPVQPYSYKQDILNQSGHQVPMYSSGPNRYGQQMVHNGMGGQVRGWNQRCRPPMRGFRGNQWPHPGSPSGPPPHPHMGHPGHMVPSLLPHGAFKHPPPPRGYFGAHLAPRPPPLFNPQGNAHAGRNQGGHQSGSHQKSKNKKRHEETTCSDSNIVPDKAKGGVLLSPENKPVSKSRQRNSAPPFPSRPWNREDAEKALKVEVETTLNLKNESLIIRFPDPELSRDIVKTYHPGIQNVHFQVPSGPRYCFVQLAPDVNTEKVIKILENIKFGSGHLSVEKKSTKQEEEASPESIDPYTLYIGNLPTNVNIQTVKERFPEAARVDVGFAQRMRYTRYAFIRFNSVDDAIKAYKENHNLILDSRSIIVRFRRQKGQIDLPGESKPQQPARVNVRTADLKKKDEERKIDKVKKETKDNDADDDDDDDKDDEEDEDEDEEDEDNVDDEDDDDDDDGEGEAEDDDDDDDDEEEGRKPLDDDDDEDEEDDQVGGPALPPDDEDDEDDDNIFRELDAQLGGYDGFPFNFN